MGAVKINKDDPREYDSYSYGRSGTNERHELNELNDRFMITLSSVKMNEFNYHFMITMTIVKCLYQSINL